MSLFLTNMIYILIWVSSWGVIETLISCITNNKLIILLINLIILIFSVCLYKLVTNEDLRLRNVNPNIKE